MTESEAIETLIGIRLVSGYSKSREKALDMAIAALEKQEGEGGLTMAEYIEREAAIKIVNTPNYNKHDMLFALKTIPAASAADAIAELSKPKWISVEERLPEEGKNVLVCICADGKYDITRGWYDKKQGFCCWDDAAMESADFTKYWMQMPEPPKEE